MFLAHWGLKESPFRGAVDPRFFFLAPTHEEALARMHFLADERRSLGLVLGSSGFGKSLLLEVFAGQSRYNGRQVAKANLMGLDAREMVWQLAAQFGVNPARNAPLGQLWHALSDKIAELRFQQVATIILLDDADEATNEVIDHVGRLALLDQSPDARLTLVLSAQPSRIERLGLRILELAELRVDIEAWNEDDTKAYIELALGEAGRATPTFSDDAIAVIHRLAAGVPRRVKQLAELALLAGAGAEVRLIDVDTIEGVYQELGVIRTGSFV